MGWVITRDHFEEGDGRKGVGQTKPEAVEDGISMVNAGRIIISSNLTKDDIGENPIPFKLYGDDDDLAYSGFISEEWLNGHEYLAFAPLAFGEADYGCTYMKYADPVDGEWKVL